MGTSYSVPAHVHVFDVVEDERARRWAVAQHLLVDLVAVRGEQRPPVALVQTVSCHGVGLEGFRMVGKVIFR